MSLRVLNIKHGLSQRISLISLFILLFLSLSLIISNRLQADTNDWDDTIRKENLIAQPVGWFHLKYLMDLTKRQIITKPSPGNRLVLIVIRFNNKNTYRFEFNDDAHDMVVFSGKGKIFSTLIIPKGYKLAYRCDGSRTITISPGETVFCEFLLELPWKIRELSVAVPFPGEKSPGKWILNVKDKRTSNYFGYQQRPRLPGFDDPQFGDNINLIIPENWLERTDKELDYIDPSGGFSPVRYRGKYSLYMIGFRTSSLSKQVFHETNFSAFTYDRRRLEIVDLSPTIDCQARGDEIIASCALWFYGPRNLRTVHLHYDFGSIDGYWKLKLDREGPHYLL